MCFFLPAGASYAVSAYVSSYVTKVDKFENISWREVYREIDEELRSGINNLEAKEGKDDV